MAKAAARSSTPTKNRLYSLTSFTKTPTAKLFLFLLFFLPFIFFSGVASPYEAPKVIVFELIVELLLFVTVLKRQVDLRSLDKKLVVPIFIILAISIFDLIFWHTPTTLFGNIYRLQGIFLLWHLLIFSLIASQLTLKIPRYIPITSLLLLLILAYPNSIDLRAVSTLGEPNALAATAIFLWPFLSALFIPGLIIAALIIFLSGSTSAVVAFSLQATLLIFSRFRRLQKFRLLAATSLLLASLALPFFAKKQIYENRTLIWKTAFYTGFKSPILGSGFGNIESALEKAGSDLPNNFLKNEYVDSAHNIFLDWWVQGGIIGLSILIYLIIQTVRNSSKKRGSTELLAFWGILTMMSFNPASIVTLAAFWFLIGQGFIPYQKGRWHTP